METAGVFAKKHHKVQVREESDRATPCACRAHQQQHGRGIPNCTSTDTVPRYPSDIVLVKIARPRPGVANHIAEMQNCVQRH
eukprot:scaffold238692_cov20-Prasinocladus_malaysianus.AAC.1